MTDSLQASASWARRSTKRRSTAPLLEQNGFTTMRGIAASRRRGWAKYGDRQPVHRALGPTSDCNSQASHKPASRIHDPIIGAAGPRRRPPTPARRYIIAASDRGEKVLEREKLPGTIRSGRARRGSLGSKAYYGRAGCSRMSMRSHPHRRISADAMGRCGAPRAGVVSNAVECESRTKHRPVRPGDWPPRLSMPSRRMDGPACETSARASRFAAAIVTTLNHRCVDRPNVVRARRRCVLLTSQTRFEGIRPLGDRRHMSDGAR